MGLGVFGPRSATSPVPGTVVLEVEAAERIEAHNEQLKRASGRHNDIMPQPSDDPNDPLNWPSWKNLAVLAVELNRSFGQITLISGYQLLVAGACGPLVSALSRKYGKRPVFLFSSSICLVGTIIGSFSYTYSTLLAARTIQGFTLTAYESLVFSVVGDLFFVHQRGVWTMVMTFTLTCVSNLVSVVSGSITFALGWHYLFHIMVASADANTNEKEDGVIGVKDVRQVEAVTSVPKKKTFWQEIAIYNGTFTDENLFSLIIAPFVVCSNMLALWTIFITGAVTPFYVAIAYVTAQLFSPPPYNLPTAAVGYISLGPFIGGALGSVLIGMLLDPLTLWLTKKNKGIYEPEFRLALTPLGLLCGIGLFGFGDLSAEQGSVYGVAVMWGVMLCGCSFIIGPYPAYTIDAFRDMASQIFIADVIF
ncbi:hypothetical protein SCUCBS95973_009123 [Sporothrix curviconia]|uniref:Major facilitator superfamily (MFS) profile domain-containing protein n=1 Tax=Sporothrix curviconia TaxID=1260050 RepID=A0ABP0CSD0_9PEZI